MKVLHKPSHEQHGSDLRDIPVGIPFQLLFSSVDVVFTRTSYNPNVDYLVINLRSGAHVFLSPTAKVRCYYPEAELYLRKGEQK